MIRNLLSAALALAFLTGALPATAGEAETGIAPSAQVVADDELAQTFGKGVGAAGIQLVTTWQTAGATYQTGATVNLDLSGGTPQISVADWNAKTTNPTGAPPGPVATGEVSGSFDADRIHGIGQAILIAANGNTVKNVATISLVDAVHFAADPTGKTCGAVCTSTIAGDRLSVAIALPSGTVAQGFGPSGIFQNAKVLTDNNVVSNMLKMQVRVATGTGGGTYLPFFAPLPGVR